ncbi:acetyl-CoA synthetase [Zafaria cholistanensis]|uniref:Acetyl-CoA synthetase n=1 Tax=Zafaria cholistanensis TaxID=1682741 RepID=A0A5A7NNR8_9MICC|nr:acetate--CoA ligase family protein [Zafaria cholistanensis]GER22279.1 acetyl-CoA synthetase [Zafaria cholistanensis]
MNAPTLTSTANRLPLDLASVLAPRSIAVVGASGNEAGYSSRSLTNLLRTGYAGRIFPVNPRHTELGGLACYPSVRAIGEPVDAAILLVRSDLVPDAVRDCVDAGVKVITVCSAGFAEDGEAGRARQRELVELARTGGSRLLGPNCIGAVGVAEKVVACPTLNITDVFTPGAVSIISQSGGMAVNLFNRAQGAGIGIRGFVSVGNEADIDVADLVDALADDEHTKVIVLFVEELRDVPAFTAAVAKAHRAGKPVLALKVGRSEAGARSSLSHTGALAGSYRVFRSVMEQIGVLVVDSVDALIHTADLMAKVEPPASNRILIVSPSGGECSYAADRASELGLEVPALGEDTIRALSRDMRFGTPSNPFDLTGQVIGNSGFLRSVLDELERAPEFDLALYAIPTWGAHDAERLLPGFIAAAEASTKPTVISAWTAANLTQRGEQVLAAGRAAHFGSVDAALTALSHLVRWAGLRSAATAAGPRGGTAAVPRPAGLPDLPTEHQAKAFLRRHGLPVSREVLLKDAAGAAGAAAGIGWPLVAKQLCAGVVHKSDLGLVRVGVRGEADLARAVGDFADIVAAQGLESEGLLLAELREGAEVIIGGIRDPRFGPLVMIGAGGVLAELVDDVVFRQCPLTREEAGGALDELAVGRLLRGHRGTRYDRESLIGLIVDFSELFAASGWLQQADLNPVIVSEAPGGAVIVDAALILDPSTKE